MNSPNSKKEISDAAGRIVGVFDALLPEGLELSQQDKLQQVLEDFADAIIAATKSESRE